MEVAGQRTKCGGDVPALGSIQCRDGLPRGLSFILPRIQSSGAGVAEVVKEARARDHTMCWWCGEIVGRLGQDVK